MHNLVCKSHRQFANPLKDNRMQISRWTAEGKEKKIYVHWDLYIMFNFMDPGRKRHSNKALAPDPEHLKPQSLYQKHCRRNIPGDESKSTQDLFNYRSV